MCPSSHVRRRVAAVDDAVRTAVLDRLGTADTMRHLLAGDPKDPSTYFNGYDKSAVSPISCPDNVTFDSRGNLWIATDGQPGTLNYNDGLFVMPVDGPEKGKLRQFLAVPTGAETCGPLISKDERTVFVAVQHPGEVDGATADKPASRFPYTGFKGPRPAVIQVFRS